MKVLVIEDNRQVVRDISFCLQIRYPEVTVVSVAKGKKGIEMVETEAPALVMANSSLPDIATTDLVSSIREFSDVPLIVLSEAESEMDRARELASNLRAWFLSAANYLSISAHARYSFPASESN